MLIKLLSIAVCAISSFVVAVINADSQTTGPDLVDQTDIAIAVVNSMNPEGEHSWDLEFEGYNSQGSNKILLDGNPMTLASQYISGD